MAASLKINDILSQVRKLDKEDQLNLLQRMVLLLKKSDETQKPRLASLSGLGSEVWKGTDIDGYVDGERAW